MSQSHDPFRAMADDAPVLMWMAGTDAGCTFFNKQWLIFTGRTLEQERGNGWAEGVHPEDFDRCLDIYLTAFRERLPFEMEYRLRRADGVYRWIFDRGVPWFLDGGAFAGYIGSALDITDRKLAEEALRERDNRLRLLVEQMPALLWTTDTDLRFTSSLGTGAGLSVQPNRLAGQSLFKVLETDDERFAPIAAHRRALLGESVSYEVDWQNHAYQAHVEPLRNAAGEIAGVIGVALDITDRKQAEEKYRRIVETAGEGIWLIDAESRTTFVNQRMAEMLGYSVEEMLGRSLFDFMDEEGRTIAEANVERRRQGIGEQHDFKFRRKDGSEVWTLVSARPFLDDQGRYGGALGMITDITERQRAEQALRESEARLRLLNTLSSELTSGMPAGEIVERTLRLVHQDFPDFRVAYSTFDQHGHMRVTGSQEPPGMPPIAGLEADLTVAPQYLRSLRGGQPLAVEDTAQDPRLAPFLEALAAAHTRAVLDVPLHHSRELIGLLCFDSPQPRCWSQHEITALTEVAKCLAFAIAQAAAEQELRSSEEKFRQLADNIREVFFVADAETSRTLYVSPAYEQIWGQSRESAYSKPRAWLDAVHPEDRERLTRAPAETEQEFVHEYRIIRPDGTVRWILSRASPIRDAAGRVYRRVGVCEDITERRELEEKLCQSQKMDAIGRLAGGVAHDFNNVLTAILGYADLLREGLPPDDPRRASVEEIYRAGERAAAMTRQLMAFSRRQVLWPKILNLNAVVTGMENMVRRLVGENIEVRTVLEPRLGNVKADPTQMEQVLLNLVVNARDAMPQGGRLTIETINEDSGARVMLRVTDTGGGMDAETRSHLFEPFFTAKAIGKGTGLGLSTVFGIVQQSGGEIDVESEPGRGATFRIHLPRVDEPVEALEPEAPLDSVGGSETVLLVEDETPVRVLAAQFLSHQGYRVLEASNGAEALDLCEPDEPIDLLVTDVVMPGMSGPELAQQILIRLPGIQVLCISGYPRPAFDPKQPASFPFPLLEKPFTSEALGLAVRRVLDGRNGPTPAHVSPSK